MIHLLILAAAILHLQDPAGDAVGDGTLTPPTAPVYANTAAFDLQSVTLTDAPDLTVRVSLGALPDAGGLANGFSNPIVEVYLDTGPGGAEKLLPGSGMTMAPKHGWEIALRATGDTAYAVEAQAQGTPSSWPRLPVKVDVSGSTLTLHTSIPRPKRAELFAITGVYDPFTKDGWRPVSPAPSPWAFSSPTQQPAVVDLLASNQRAQRREIDSGVLTPYRSPTHGIGWLLLMLLGLLLAAFGAVVRRRVRAPERPAADASAGAQGAADEAEGSGPEGAPPYRRFLDEDEEAELWPDAEASVDRAVAAAFEAPTDTPSAAGDAETGADREDGAEGDRPDVEGGDVEGAEDEQPARAGAPREWTSGRDSGEDGSEAEAAAVTEADTATDTEADTEADAEADPNPAAETEEETQEQPEDGADDARRR